MLLIRFSFLLRTICKYIYEISPSTTDSGLHQDKVGESWTNTERGTIGNQAHPLNSAPPILKLLTDLLKISKCDTQCNSRSARQKNKIIGKLIRDPNNAEIFMTRAAIELLPQKKIHEGEKSTCFPFISLNLHDCTISGKADLSAAEPLYGMKPSNPSLSHDCTISGKAELSAAEPLYGMKPISFTRLHTVGFWL